MGVVLDPAAGEHRVEHLAVLGAADDPVDDIGGDALGGVDGGGVAELDMLGHVRRGQDRVQPRGRVPHRQGAVGPDVGDDPAVAVLHPVGATHPEPSVVAATDHHVPTMRRTAIGETDRRARDTARCLSAKVQLTHQLAGRREHQAVAPTDAFPRPGSEDVVEERRHVADVDAVVVK